MRGTPNGNKATQRYGAAAAEAAEAVQCGAVWCERSRAGLVVMVRWIVAWQ